MARSIAVVSPTPPRSASSSSLAAGADLVDLHGFLPFEEPVGEHEVRAARTAIDDAIGLDFDSSDVLCADVAVGIDPHRRDAGGAQIVLREEFGTILFPSLHEPARGPPIG